MSLRTHLCSLWDRFTGLAAIVAPLLARLVIGYGFTQTGRGKWTNFDNTVQFFSSLGIPAPTANAAFIATLELVGGWALVFGLATRPIALLLSSTMVVAILTADRANFLAALSGSESVLTDVTPVVFLMPLAFLIAMGAGKLSLDHLLSRWWSSRRNPRLA